VAKFKPLRNGVDSNYVLGGGLEPDFRVLFSAIFHGVSLGDFHLGRNLWKWAEAKVWSFVVNLRTKFLSVAIVPGCFRRFSAASYSAAETELSGGQSGRTGSVE
jgi:hypothetical protein